VERAVLWEQVIVGAPKQAPALNGAEPAGAQGALSGPLLGRSPSGALAEAGMLPHPYQTLIRDCVIGAHSTIFAGCQINGAIIAEQCTIEAGNVLTGGLRLWPKKTLAERTITF
jgi:hypothetical protein